MGPTDYAVADYILDRIICEKEVVLFGPEKPAPIDSILMKCAQVRAFVNFYDCYLPYLDSIHPKIFYLSGAKPLHAFNCFVGRNGTLHNAHVFTSMPADEMLQGKTPGIWEFPHHKTRGFKNARWGFVEKLFEAMKSSPLTGFIALHHLLSFNPRSVFITGWNLYDKQPLTSMRMGRPHRGVHDLVKHQNYLADLVLECPTIIVEEELRAKLFA